MDFLIVLFPKQDHNLKTKGCKLNLLKQRRK